MYANLSGLVVFALVGSSAASTCLTPVVRTRTGRDVGSFGNTVCPNQIATCSALCGKTSTNTCTSNNNGEDNPFKSITYCYQCTCSDGSTPDLAKYAGTVPTVVCERALDNCEYSYDQVGKSPPPGACTACAQDAPPAPKATTTAVATTIATTSTPKTTPTSTTTPKTTSTTAKPTTSSAKPESTTTSTVVEETTSSTSSEVPSTTEVLSSVLSSKVSSILSSSVLSSTRGPGTTISAITVPSITRTQPPLSSSTGAAATKGMGVGVGIVGIVFVQVVRLVL
ncbi:hypothetical protein B0H67DRAFT_103813 [Lasiosphaeris hirsuta]|uniref:DUF7707 domain-containing protein n=1 Tax=Lasiosphaeris hirsuta TaxID=260670 RepID=A0AA40AYK6_9PEZI|nr:hypothetical protein B0H67DRAFT_103813 [Lasiosphaeris hirsuta]